MAKLTAAATVAAAAVAATAAASPAGRREMGALAAGEGIPKGAGG
jgi:hypothetical protein